MSVKAVEMVREIRYKHYKEIKDLPVEEQKALIMEKSERLQARYKATKEKTAPK
jgi:hypothetical protein